MASKQAFKQQLFCVISRAKLVAATRNTELIAHSPCAQVRNAETQFGGRYSVALKLAALKLSEVCVNVGMLWNVC